MGGPRHKQRPPVKASRTHQVRREEGAYMKRLLVALAVLGLFALGVPAASAQVGYGYGSPYGYPGYGQYGAPSTYQPFSMPFYAATGYGSPATTLGSYGAP